MSKPVLGRRGFLAAVSTGLVGAAALPGISADGEVTGKGRTLAPRRRACQKEQAGPPGRTGMKMWWNR